MCLWQYTVEGLTVKQLKISAVFEMWPQLRAQWSSGI